MSVGGEADKREWDGWMASLTRRTWVWASSVRWWWIGKPGMLQAMGSQRVRHAWVTELNWTKNSEKSVQFSSVQSLSRIWPFATPWLQHASPPCPSPTPGVYSNSGPLSQWRHPTISFSVIRFSSCLQSFPASGSFQIVLLLNAKKKKKKKR